MDMTTFQSICFLSLNSSICHYSQMIFFISTIATLIILPWLPKYFLEDTIIFNEHWFVYLESIN